MEEGGVGVRNNGGVEEETDGLAGDSSHSDAVIDAFPGRGAGAGSRGGRRGGRNGRGRISFAKAFSSFLESQSQAMEPTSGEVPPVFCPPKAMAATATVPADWARKGFADAKLPAASIGCSAGSQDVAALLDERDRDSLFDDNVLQQLSYSMRVLEKATGAASAPIQLPPPVKKESLASLPTTQKVCQIAGVESSEQKDEQDEYHQPNGLEEQPKPYAGNCVAEEGAVRTLSELSARQWELPPTPSTEEPPMQTSPALQPQSLRADPRFLRASRSSQKPQPEPPPEPYQAAQASAEGVGHLRSPRESEAASSTCETVIVAPDAELRVNRHVAAGVSEFPRPVSIASPTAVDRHQPRPMEFLDPRSDQGLRRPGAKGKQSPPAVGEESEGLAVRASSDTSSDEADDDLFAAVAEHVEKWTQGTLRRMQQQTAKMHGSSPVKRPPHSMPPGD